VENDGSANISAVHFNTTEALSSVITDVDSSGFLGHLYRRIAPSTGAHDLQADFVNAGSTAVLSGLTFTGAHQTTPLNTAASQGSAGFITDATMDVLSATDELVFDCHATDSPEAITYGGGQTSQTTDTVLFNFSASTKAGGAPTVTMTRGWGGGSQRSALFGASVKPVAGAPPAASRRTIVVQ
jgi:hypothetical protein